MRVGCNAGHLLAGGGSACGCSLYILLLLTLTLCGNTTHLLNKVVFCTIYSLYPTLFGNGLGVLLHRHLQFSGCGIFFRLNLLQRQQVQKILVHLVILLQRSGVIPVRIRFFLHHTVNSHTYNPPLAGYGAECGFFCARVVPLTSVSTTKQTANKATDTALS